MPASAPCSLGAPLSSLPSLRDPSWSLFHGFSLLLRISRVTSPPLTNNLTSTVSAYTESLKSSRNALTVSYFTFGIAVCDDIFMSDNSLGDHSF